jgi:hypothetical protein
LLDVCARQYALQYVLGIQTPQPVWAAVGNAYHSAIEQHELARVDGDIWTLEQTEAAALQALADLGGGGDEQEYEVLSAVGHFWNTPDREMGCTIREYIGAMTPVKLEGYFRLDMIDGAQPLAGTFDGLYLDHTGRHRLIDHKTAASFGNWPRSGDGHRTQASFYAAALTVSPDFPDITELPQVDYLVVRKKVGKTKGFEGARIVSVEPDLHDVAILGQRVRAAEQLLTAGEYLPNPAATFCSKQWCAFWDRCQGTGELAGDFPRLASRLSQELSIVSSASAGVAHKGDSNGR